MEKVYAKKEQCYGCTACANICPQGAITMQEDKEGFFYPEICLNKCIDCKICVKVCPFHSEKKQEDYKQRYFAVQHRNPQIVMESSSGGIFTALSDCVLRTGGVIYGAGFSEGFIIRHYRALDEDTRNKHRGSKYVQSDMNRVMKEILEDLSAGKTVLFSGSPCQTAGVRNYILAKRKVLNNLLLCDFICHGVASPKVWRDYIKYLEKNCDGKLERYKFRGKREGWHNFFPLIEADGLDVSLRYRNKDSFFLLYATCYLNRTSCYSCRFTSYDRFSDITFADFWNVKEVAAHLDNNTGTSEVLINTRRGEEWFQRCISEIKFEECTRKQAWQPHLEYPNELPGKRAQFWQEYAERGFEETLHKYGKGNFMSKCKRIAMPIVKKTGLYVAAGKLYGFIFSGKAVRKNGKNK